MNRLISGDVLNLCNSSAFLTQQKNFVSALGWITYTLVVFKDNRRLVSEY